MHVSRCALHSPVNRCSCPSRIFLWPTPTSCTYALLSSSVWVLGHDRGRVDGKNLKQYFLSEEWDRLQSIISWCDPLGIERAGNLYRTVADSLQGVEDKRNEKEGILWKVRKLRKTKIWIHPPKLKLHETLFWKEMGDYWISIYLAGNGKRG